MGTRGGSEGLYLRGVVIPGIYTGRRGINLADNSETEHLRRRAGEGITDASGGGRVVGVGRGERPTRGVHPGRPVRGKLQPEIRVEHAVLAWRVRAVGKDD